MRLIDVDALLDKLCGDDPANMEDYYYNAIKESPTIEAEPVRHGHWIDADEEELILAGTCSACQWECHLYEDDVVGMPYCPNCGAKMRGEADE